MVQMASSGFGGVMAIKALVDMDAQGWMFFLAFGAAVSAGMVFVIFAIACLTAVDGMVGSWEKKLKAWHICVYRRIEALLRQHWRMFFAMMVMRRVAQQHAGAFKAYDAVDEMLWVIYGIYCTPV